MDTLSTPSDETKRAADIGITLRVSAAMDRVTPPGTRPRGAECPTCDDGILTITHPRRCKACVLEGF